MSAAYAEEQGYLQLLRDTLNYGDKKQTRNGLVYSQFGTMITYDISKSFPLLTTKKIFTKGIIYELLWFMKGCTDAKELQKDGVHIWDLNSSREYLDSIGLNYPDGILGPVYGWQWRAFNQPYDPHNPNVSISDPSYQVDQVDQGDQLKYIIEELSKPDNSRRAVLSAWNPIQFAEMALPPCHMLYTFYKDSKGLSCMMNMRSSDLFLGLPFNIASTALFVHIIAKALHLNVSRICITAADSHIYDEHIGAIQKQLENPLISDKPTLNITREAPELSSSIDEKIKWIESLQYNDFVISNYQSAAAIKAPIK
jgi:thymidylate synthase